MKIANLLVKPLIYLITEGICTPENFSNEKKRILNKIGLAVNAKIELIQIREKKIPASLVFEITFEAVKISQNSATKILVNDRADIALAANAGGVHLTSSSIPTERIRNSFPNNFVIGVSTHIIEEAEKAKKFGADFVTFSPIFWTESKEEYGKPQGVEKLREVCERLGEFPVIALGGISVTNVSQVVEHGAKGYASIRYLNNEQNLQNLAARLDGQLKVKVDK